MKRLARELLAFGFASSSLSAQATSDSTAVRFAGFIDTYIAYDGGRPTSRDRSLTTQAVRHNEFNVNLAFLEATLSGNRTRGRFAAQFGTSVQANYAGEPRIGANSGPEITRHIQEAFVGVQLHDATWIDAGVFFSHIGREGWISRDNLTYTRSLVADFSPYYQSGVRLSWEPSKRVHVQLSVLNGWQNISETNSDKAVGARVDVALDSSSVLSIYNFVGNEAPAGDDSRARFFQGASLRSKLMDGLEVIATVDAGIEQRDEGSAHWFGTALIARRRLTPTIFVVARGEHFSDRDQVVVLTGVAAPFRATGGSIGIDVVPRTGLMWRSEVRGLRNREGVFAAHDGNHRGNAAFVSSLALSF